MKYSVHMACSSFLYFFTSSSMVTVSPFGSFTLQLSQASVSSFAAYPGYTGNLQPMGYAHVSSESLGMCLR